MAVQRVMFSCAVFSLLSFMFCLSNSQRCCVETAKRCQAFSSPFTDPIIGLLFEFSRIKRRDDITERGLRSDISDNTERVLEVSSAYGSLSSVSLSKIEQFQRSCTMKPKSRLNSR